MFNKSPNLPEMFLKGSQSSVVTHVQSMIHVSKMFAQLDGVTITDFESLLTPRGTFLASLVTSYEIVLEKWSKMCPTIRGQDDHLRFQIPLRSNNTALGPLEKHFW
jgi:hypothetical protein